jgi:hypothetical protein
MIENVIANELESSIGQLTFGTNLFIGRATASKYVLIIDKGTDFHLDDGSVRRLKVNILVHGWDYSAGNALSEEIIEAMLALNGTYTDESVEHVIKSVGFDRKSSYVNYSDNQYEYSVNLTIHYS